MNSPGSPDSPQPDSPGLSVIAWGTYDTGKPRVRILLQAARRSGIDLREIHGDVWRGVEDKSQIRGFGARARHLIRWLGAYPGLLLRYLRCPRHDLVFIPYMGHLDVILIRPFARLRGARVVWDALLSLHGTVVEDRALVASGGAVARAIETLDWLAFRCADRVITGTRARAEQYASQYRIDPRRICPIYIGTELSRFRPARQGAREMSGRPRALFYGQFSPLHGLPTVLEAAATAAGRQWDWLFIGTGQEGWRIGEWLNREPMPHARWLDWVPYEDLPDCLAASDICLGNFGGSRKAATGISNKVYQIIACGRPLVTSDTPAVRELVDPDAPGVYLVPPEDSAALARLLGQLVQEVPHLREGCFHQEIVQQFRPALLGQQLAGVFVSALGADNREGYAA